MKIRNIILVCTTIILISCNKFLDVKPEDRFLEEQVFSNELSVYNALNGIYMNLSKPDLYGGHLSMSTIDVMAQYYNHNIKWQQYAIYRYGDDEVKGRFSSIWNTSYLAILNTNNFINKLDQTFGVVSDARKNLLMGEAYAIRAFIHFDILRLFGPIYASDPEKISIPYFTTTTDKVQPLLSAKVVVENVLTDLKRAEELLEKDPVRSDGIVKTSGIDVLGDFDKLRNRRLNYYAVLALKARVLLYKGDKKAALDAAERVISEGTKWFPWTSEKLTTPGIADPDRNFSSEIIFGIQNNQMYNQQNSLFNSSISQDAILAPTKLRLDAVYENNLNDFRNRINWVSTTNKPYRTFVKYSDISDKGLFFRQFQSLIRLTEMYFIAAESTADKGTALKYINMVRFYRGLTPVANNINVDIEDLLLKEYRKEFWGEGQLFYYYKRKAVPIIPSGADGADMPMNTAKYIVPLPDSEIQNR
ncbi:RagB/SusD family nutrient uptake outer membrane protein [Sphingobacterium spiritivorum]